jgi:hypothetical protein
MDIETGLNRFAKVVQGLGVLWLVLCGSVAVFGFSEVDSFVVGIGVVGLAIAWAIAWVIRGFAQKKA